MLRARVGRADPSAVCETFCCIFLSGNVLCLSPPHFQLPGVCPSSPCLGSSATISPGLVAPGTAGVPWEVGDGAQTPTVGVQEGPGLQVDVDGAENGSGVGLAAPLALWSGCPICPPCPPALRGVPQVSLCPGSVPLWGTVSSGSAGRTWGQTWLLTDSPGVPAGTPVPPAMSLQGPRCPQGRVAGGGRCWDTGLTVTNSRAEPRSCPGDTGRERGGRGDSVTSLAHGWEEAEILEIRTVYKSLFNCFLTLVLPSGC